MNCKTIVRGNVPCAALALLVRPQTLRRTKSLRVLCQGPNGSLHVAPPGSKEPLGDTELVEGGEGFVWRFVFAVAMFSNVYVLLCLCGCFCWPPSPRSAGEPVAMLFARLLFGWLLRRMAEAEIPLRVHLHGARAWQTRFAAGGGEPGRRQAALA